MKHILFYTDTPHVGGAEKQMLLLARHLRNQGYAVSLAYGSYSRLNAMHDEFSEVCEKIYVLPTFHKHDPRHYFGLKKLLRLQAKTGNPFDAVHLHLWNPGSCRYGFFVATHAHMPIITTEHDPFPLRGMKRFIKKSALKKTLQTIVLSHENEEMMLTEYGVSKEKINLVPNGIEISQFTGGVQRAVLPVQKGDTVMTCIAELHPRKGHRYLFEAFKKLQATTPNLQLVLVGDGPIRTELEKKYGGPNVHFLGWRNDVIQILATSDVLVLPSLKEAFGLVILEAMASQVPVIATHAGGVPDLIENGKTGYLVPPANSDRIAEAMRNILHNPDQKKDVIVAALKQVKNRFTAEKMAENTAHVYQKIFSP